MQTLTKTISGSKIIIHTLKNLGVDSIFGYPGGVLLNFYDELSKQSDIKHYLMRHEQAACHAAEGYYRVTGKCGVLLVTSGPGATNIITGLANAYLDGSPLIAITGQVPSEHLHKNAFQEVDIVNMTKTCTKKNYQINSIEELQSTIIDAYNTAMTGKKGPVLIDITKNVFSEKAEFVEKKIDKFIEQTNIDDNLKQKISKTVECLNTAKRPVIIAGGGSSYEDIQKLSHKLNIPVVKTMMGFYPANDPNYVGMIGIFGENCANQIIKDSDLIFAIGTRLNDRINCCFTKEELYKNLICLNIDKSDIPKSEFNILSLIGDSKRILDSINNEIYIVKNKDWLEYSRLLSIENPKPQKRSNLLHTYEVIEAIQQYFQDDLPIITTEVGQHQVLASKYFKFNKPGKFITSGGLGTMGFGFPAAIGASIARADSPVICIAGDGSIQMNIQELATCMDYNLPIKIFIFNNGYLGMVRQFQEKSCEGRYFATKISNPDFVKLAQSYGAVGIRVEKKDDIKPALQKAFSVNKTVIIDFVIEEMEVI